MKNKIQENEARCVFRKEDIEKYLPNEKAESWLIKNKKWIEEAMMKAGFEAIESLIEYDKHNNPDYFNHNS